MGLETAVYIGDLVQTNPSGGLDTKDKGDDHLRLIKSTLQATFPGFSGRFHRIVDKSGAYTAGAADNTVVFRTTSTWTLTLTAPATLGNGWSILVFNSGAGIITLAPAAGTINGGASLALAAGTFACIFSDGSVFVALVGFISTAAGLNFNNSGKLGLGISPTFLLDLKTGGFNDGLNITDSTTAVSGGLFVESGQIAVRARSNHALVLATNDTRQATINNQGALYINQSGSEVFGGEKFLVSRGSNAILMGLYGSSASFTTSIALLQTETSPSTSWNFLDLRSAGGAQQLIIRGDGSFNRAIVGSPTGGGQTATLNAEAIKVNNDPVATKGANNAFTGANTFTGTTLNGTTTNGGTISGGTIAPTTLTVPSGTTLTAPVLSGTVTGTYTLGGTPTVSGATLSGTTQFSGSVTSSKSAASGFTRVGPNMCVADIPIKVAGDSLVLDAWTTINNVVLDGAKAAALRVVMLKGSTSGDQVMFLRKTGSGATGDNSTVVTRIPDTDAGLPHFSTMHGTRIVQLDSNGDFDYFYAANGDSGFGNEAAIYVDAYWD